MKGPKADTVYFKGMWSLLDAGVEIICNPV